MRIFFAKAPHQPVDCSARALRFLAARFLLRLVLVRFRSPIFYDACQRGGRGGKEEEEWQGKARG